MPAPQDLAETEPELFFFVIVGDVPDLGGEYRSISHSVPGLLLGLRIGHGGRSPAPGGSQPP
jgi:hypothetical protein